MAFVRPEAMAQIRRFGEPVLYLAVAGWGLWVGFSAVSRGAWTGLVPLILGMLAALALFNAVQRAVLSWRTRFGGPGLVEVDEGRIVYYGPQGGAVLALDLIETVEMITTDDGPAGDDLFWHVTDSHGQSVLIPGGAKGTQHLLDRLGSLPGFDHMAAMRAAQSTQPARFALWRRRATRDIAPPS